MTNINELVDHCIERVQQTEEYLEYVAARNKIAEDPMLKIRLDAYRGENFSMQLGNDPDALFDAGDRLREKYEDLFANPDVMRFFNAELTFCRLMQTLQSRILEGIDFEL